MNILFVAERISNQRHIDAIQRGLKLNIPLFVISAFSVMLASVPFPWYRQMMRELLGPQWQVLWQSVADASLNGISILTAIGTSYYLSERDNSHKSRQLHPLMVSFVSVACFIALIYPFVAEEGSGLPFAWTGKTGIFFAIIVAVAATELFLWLCSYEELTLRQTADVGDPILAQALVCILPAAMTVLGFVGLKMGAVALQAPDLYSYLTIQAIGWFQNIGDQIEQMVLLNFVMHLLWFFGMHGNNIMEPVLQQIQLAVTPEVVAGVPLEHRADLTKTFFDVFVLIGGAGSTIGLMLALLLVSQRASIKWLLRFSLIPAIFNINEPMVFCLPIVLNPVFGIPFLMVPLVSLGLAYGAVSTGLVSPVTQVVHWTTPPLVSGYLATGSWTGTALQFFSIVIGALLYYPFVKINEKRKGQEVEKAFHRACEETASFHPLSRRQLLRRQDEMGTLARLLAADLKTALSKGELFLEYQPQVNHDHIVVGVEALLRWNHPLHGRVPPPLIVVIAEETGLIHHLGRWVVQSACQQLRSWNVNGLNQIRMSVNASALQFQDAAFGQFITETVVGQGIRPEELEIEITETIAMKEEANTGHNLAVLQAGKVRIAIDDFGMGHTSLRYIKLFPINTLKIDRVLSIEVEKDRSCQEIVASIVSLCSSLDIEVVAEFVETEQQRDVLKRVGCKIYQGYYYSPPLPPMAAAQYILRKNQLSVRVVCGGTEGSNGV